VQKEVDIRMIDVQTLTGRPDWGSAIVESISIGGADFVGDLVRKHFPMVPYPKLVAGAVLAMWGDRLHPLVRVAGQGILKQSVGEIVFGLLRPMIPAGGGSSSSSAQVRKEQTVSSYIKARWGI